MGSSTSELPRKEMMTEEEEEEYSELAFKLVTSSVLPMVLKAAIELDLHEIMAKMAGGPDGTGEFSAADLSSRLPTTNPDAPTMLDRILRVLATHSLLTCGYSLTTTKDGKLQRFLLKNEDGVSFSPLQIMLQDKVYMESWYYVKDAVLHGGAPFTAYGMNCFDYHGTDPKFSTLFNDSMLNLSTMVVRKILQNYTGFQGIRSLVDVGGGTGAVGGLIAKEYPEIKVTNLDIPHVCHPGGPTTDRQDPKTPPLREIGFCLVRSLYYAFAGVEHIEGNMFESVSQGDTIFVKWIIHDWGDEFCLKLLENCFKALPEDGKAIVVEMLLPDEPTSITSCNADHSTIPVGFDALMFAFNNGGKERTLEEFDSLARAAGFVAIKPICQAFHFWVIEFHKRSPTDLAWGSMK